MNLLIVGSVAYDSVETPLGKIDDGLGGSATFISLAASHFTSGIALCGVVGSDFYEEHLQLFKSKGIDIEGLQIIADGKTFRWGGKYHPNMNERDTLFTELNVFENFNPVIPENLKKTKFVVLGNIIPALQLKVLEQLENPEFVICDTMNLWINIAKDDLMKVINKVNCLIINDSEAKLLTNEFNLIKAAKKLLENNLDMLIIKKGEHGALLFMEDKVFVAPALPMSSVFDPTGAGDSFAGGFGGYLCKTADLSFENAKRAVIYGSVVASFCCEKFSTEGIEKLTEQDIIERFDQLHEISRF